MAKKELTKEQMDELMRVIDQVKASGKVKKGANEVTKAIERGNAKIVLVASDVTPPELVMHLPILCEEKSVTCVVGGTKDELGSAAGLTIGTVALAVIDDGAAKAELKRFIDSLQ